MIFFKLFNSFQYLIYIQISHLAFNFYALKTFDKSERTIGSGLITMYVPHNDAKQRGK